MAQLWLWGQNNYGQLGDNTTDDKSSPIQTIAGGSDWVAVAGGYDMTLALKNDGTVWSWGFDSHGALGQNTENVDLSSPTQIGTDTDWAFINASNWYWGICAGIKNDGSLWLWGYNNYGNLGDDTSDDKSSPVQTVTGGNDWAYVSCSAYHTGAIKTDGTLWMFGRNTYGELGDDSLDQKSSPVQTIAGGNDWAQVSCSRRNTAAIKNDGTLWLWGRNSEGQLGAENTVNVSSPVQTICGGNNWAQVSVGRYFTGAIKTDGTLWMWGGNSYGALGTGDTQDYSSPVQTICGGNNWAQVSCGYDFTAALKTDGSLWVWGRNGDGQAGNESTIDISSPVQTVAGGNGWTFVSIGYHGTTALGSAYNNYQIKLTPPNRNEGTEGYMDYWIVGGKSLQRSGYIETTDGIQIRKVNEAMDGDTITNEPEKLTDLQNNGHYFIVEN